MSSKEQYSGQEMKHLTPEEAQAAMEALYSGETEKTTEISPESKYYLYGSFGYDPGKNNNIPLQDFLKEQWGWFVTEEQGRFAAAGEPVPTPEELEEIWLKPMTENERLEEVNALIDQEPSEDIKNNYADHFDIVQAQIAEAKKYAGDAQKNFQDKWRSSLVEYPPYVEEKAEEAVVEELVTKPEPDHEVKEPVPAAADKPEKLPGDIKIEQEVELQKPRFSKLSRFGQLGMEYKINIKKKGGILTKKRFVMFDLAPEAVLAYRENPETAQKVILELVQTNWGASFPKVNLDPENEIIELGIGKDKNFNPIAFLSREEIQARLPNKTAEEVEDYFRRRKHSDLLNQQERQKMWDFEGELVNTKDKNVRGWEIPLGQQVWDEAFRRHWETSVGEDKLKELRDAVRHFQEKRKARIEGETNKNRAQLAEENLENPAIQVKAKKFIEEIKKRYSSWEDFLTRGNVSGMAHYKSLRTPEAYLALGREILGAPERQKALEEYMEFYHLSTDQIRSRLRDHHVLHIPAGESFNKTIFLRHLLLRDVIENQLPGDIWKIRGKAISESVEVIPKTILGSSEILTPEQRRAMDEEDEKLMAEQEVDLNQPPTIEQIRKAIDASMEKYK